MPIMDESDVSLPKATLAKMIRERMPTDLRIGTDSLDIVIECCTEFVNLLSAESNEVASSEKKNMIHPEHVLKALEDLGFGEFVPEVRHTWEAWKEENKNKSGSMRPKGHKTAADAAGYSEEQQIVMQQKLFAEAKARSNSFQEGTYLPTTDEKHGVESTQLEAPSRFGNLSTTDMALDNSSSTPSAMYAELAARSDILPIHPLPVPPMSSEFKPTVMTSANCEEEMPEEKAEAESLLPGPPLDLTDVSLNTPVLISHNGVQRLVPWQILLSQAMQPQANQIQATRPPVAGESSIQMPVASTQMPAMQPSFPDPVALPVQTTASVEAPMQIDMTKAPDDCLNAAPPGSNLDSGMASETGQK